MKKWICLFSAGLLLLLCACGKTAYSFPETIEQLRVERGTMVNTFTENEAESIRLFTARWSWKNASSWSRLTRTIAIRLKSTARTHLCMTIAAKKSPMLS